MATRPTTGPAPAVTRRVYLDDLKVLLIAAIIVAHALIGYTDLGGNAWASSEVRETTLAEPTFVTILVLAFPFAVFLIALLFLVGGLLTPGSYDRKGARAFVRDRLLRLGVPYAVGTVLLWPALGGVVGLAVFVALPLVFPIEFAAGGWHWQAALAAALEGVLTVFGPIWLLSVAQRHLSRPLPHGAALARSSYGAFVLQGVFLYGVALALRPVGLPAEIKALVLACSRLPARSVWPGC